MERAEAEAVYAQGRETVVAVLLELAAQNALLRREVAELSEANRRLEIRVADLEERLNRNSRNSSLPPSQDPPSAPPRPRQAASGRRAGAQPGHPGRGRHPTPIASLDELIDHWPQRCQACARPFSANERWDAATPQRHQVSELPEVALTVSEHRLHRLRCPQCASETRAKAAGRRAPESLRRARAGGTLPHRRGSSPPRGPGAARRGLLRRRLRGSLVGLRLSRCGTAPVLLGPPRARLHRPPRGARRPEAVRRGRP